MYVTDLFGDPVENDDDKNHKNDKNHLSKSSSKLFPESNLKADKTKSHTKNPSENNRMFGANARMSSTQNQASSYQSQDYIYRNQASSYQNQDSYTQSIQGDKSVQNTQSAPITQSTQSTQETQATHKYRQNDFQQIEIDPHKLIDLSLIHI